MLNVGDYAILEATVFALKKRLGDELDIIVSDKDYEVSKSYYPKFKLVPWFSLVIGKSLNFRGKRFLKPIWPMIVQTNLARVYLGMKLNHLAHFLLSEQERQLLSIYQGADFVLSSGGTYLVEYYQLRDRLLDYELTLQAGTPLAFMTQSMGPFLDQSNRKRLKKIFSKSFGILLRDERSKRSIGGLIDLEKVLVTSDAVFSMADVESLNAAKGKSIPTESPKVVISLRYWQCFRNTTNDLGMANYLDAVSDFVTRLVRQFRAEITFQSTCQGIADYWTDDAETAKTLVDRLPPEIQRHVKVRSEFRTPAEIIADYSHFDIALATRMHAGILALCAGVPVLPIAYEFKTKELYSTLGMERYISDIETISGQGLYEMFCRFVEEYDCLKAELFSRVNQQKQHADVAVDWLLERARNSTSRQPQI